MKRIIFFLAVSITFFSCNAQNGDVRGKRVIADQSFWLNGNWATTIKKDTTGLVGLPDGLVTAKVVYDFVTGRLIGFGASIYTADGSLTGDRVLNMATHNITFRGGGVGDTIFSRNAIKYMDSGFLYAQIGPGATQPIIQGNTYNAGHIFEYKNTGGILNFVNTGPYTAGCTTCGLNTMGFEWHRLGQNNTDTLLHTMGAHNGPGDHHFYMCDFSGAGYPTSLVNNSVTYERGGVPFLYMIAYDNARTGVHIGNPVAWTNYQWYAFTVNQKAGFLDSVIMQGKAFVADTLRNAGNKYNAGAANTMVVFDTVSKAYYHQAIPILGSGTVNSGASNTLAYYATSTNAVSTLTAITANRALISDANGLPTHSVTTNTELTYLNGVTSAIQTQLNNRMSSLAGENYLSFASGVLTANAVNLSNTNVTGTLAAARFGALTGDVVNTVGTYGTTISNGVVTYAKMQNISATQRILGRNTAGAGPMEEITPSQTFDWYGSTRGTILFRGASAWQALAPGTSGFFLQTQSSTGDPIWAAGAAGVTTIGTINSQTKSANGAVITVPNLYLQTVDATFPGLMTSAQKMKLDSTSYGHIDKTLPDSMAWWKNDSTIYFKSQRIQLNGITIVPTTTDSTLSYNIPTTLTGAYYANQGTTTTVLHGNASGNLSFGAVALGTDVSGTLLAANFGALTGDVTNTAGNYGTTIATAAVTYAKMQNISATQRMLGRNSASGGVTEEVTFSQFLDWVGSAAQGDILYRGASTWTRLPAGTSGFYLQTQGAGANPLWAAGGGGSGITTLNTLTGASQTFATGTSGTDFGISSTGTTHTFNIPDASTSNRGLVTTATQTFGGAKSFNNTVSFISKIDKYNNSAPLNGQLLIGHTANGTFEKATLSAGTALQIVNGAGTITLNAVGPNSFLQNQNVADADYTAVTSDHMIQYTTLTAARNITLPAASTWSGHIMIVKDEVGNAATNNLTVKGTGAETVNGGASYIINTNYGSVAIYSNGTQLYTLNFFGSAGAGGSPGGSTTQVQYNSSGSFAGAAGFVFNGTSQVTLGVAGTSAGALVLSGSTSGAVTVKEPATVTSYNLTLPANGGSSGQYMKVDGSGGLSFDVTTDWIKGITLLGATVKAQTLNCTLWDAGSSSALTSGQIRFMAVYVPVAATLTGVRWLQNVAGVYTSNNTNSIGLYTYSAGVMTKVAESTNDGNLWKSTAGTFVNTPFASTYSASPGIYYIGMLYSSSAQTTAPSVQANASGGPTADFGFTNSAQLAGTLTSQTAQASTYTWSGLSTSGSRIWAGIY